MTRRRHRTGAGAIVRAIREQSDRIIGAIHETTAEQNASREAMGDVVLQKGARFLRAALDDATPRTIVTDPGGEGRPRAVTLAPPAANEGGTAPPSSGLRPGPTTPPGGPANDDEPPPRSGPRK